MTINQIKRSLETRIKHLSQERDKLRDLEFDIAEYADCAEYAIEELQSAVDKLSELV